MHVSRCCACCLAIFLQLEQHRTRLRLASKLIVFLPRREAGRVSSRRTSLFTLAAPLQFARRTEPAQARPLDRPTPIIWPWAECLNAYSPWGLHQYISFSGREIQALVGPLYVNSCANGPPPHIAGHTQQNRNTVAQLTLILSPSFPHQCVAFRPFPPAAPPEQRCHGLSSSWQSYPTTLRPKEECTGMRYIGRGNPWACNFALPEYVVSAKESSLEGWWMVVVSCLSVTRCRGRVE